MINIVDNSQIRTYSGSLTTPPCDESVSWFVVENPLAVAVSQFNKMKKIMKFNARYTQNDHFLREAENLLELAKEKFPSTA
jgi:carbonic anhydrase